MSYTVWENIEISLKFSGNYKSNPGGACSSCVATVGGVKFFSEIPGKKGELLVYLE